MYKYVTVFRVKTYYPFEIVKEIILSNCLTESIFLDRIKAEMYRYDILIKNITHHNANLSNGQITNRIELYKAKKELKKLEEQYPEKLI